MARKRGSPDNDDNSGNHHNKNNSSSSNNNMMTISLKSHEINNEDSNEQRSIDSMDNNVDKDLNSNIYIDGNSLYS